VISNPQVLAVRSGQVFSVPLTLQATTGEMIAGINGQMQYDPAYFSAPKVQAGPGAIGFTALGNETAPGKVRFVVYADPTAILGLQDRPVMNVQLTAATNLPRDGRTTITFLNGPVDASNPDKPGESSASTPTGTPIGNVAFASIVVTLDESAVEDWLFYE
jgi:hypothetical protein